MASKFKKHSVYAFFFRKMKDWETTKNSIQRIGITQQMVENKTVNTTDVHIWVNAFIWAHLGQGKP